MRPRATASNRVRAGRRARRQAEMKARPNAWAAFRPDTPAMAFDHPFDDRQADAGPFELILPVQALEHAEQLVRVGRVEAGAVVGHGEARATALLRPRRYRHLAAA